MLADASRTSVDGYVSDTDLVAGCRRGDRRAWELIVDRYQRLVYAIPIREGLRRDDAADVAQETFAALLRSMDRIEQPERLGYWLMTVARRATWKVRQGESHAVADIELLEKADAHTADETLQALWVYQSIMKLDDPCRTLVLSLFFDPAEPSYGEIAVKLGRPLGSVGPLRSRCLERLRQILEEHS